MTETVSNLEQTHAFLECMNSASGEFARIDGGASRSFLAPIPLSTFRDTMKTRLREMQEVVYCGRWPGVGEIYNVKVAGGYTTIIVKPGEVVRERLLETREKFAGRR